MNTITSLPLVSQQELFWKMREEDVTDLFKQVDRVWGRILKRGPRQDCFKDVWDLHLGNDKLAERFTMLLYKVLEKSKSTYSNTFVGLALGADLDPLQAVLDALCLWRRAMLPLLANLRQNRATFEHIADVGQGAILFCGRGSLGMDEIDFTSSVESVGTMGAIITALAIFQHARECKCISFEAFCGKKDDNPNVDDRRPAIKLFFQRIGEVWKTGYNVRSMFPGNNYGLITGSDIRYDEKMRPYWQSQEEGSVAWESIPKFHPMFRYPGSPWHKFFANQNAPILGPMDDEEKQKPIEILIPRAADDILAAWTRNYREARAKASLSGTAKKSNESEEKQYNELADGSGILYRRDQLGLLTATYSNHRLDMGQESIPKFPATDSQGNLTFPFMNGVLRAMKGLNSEEFVSDTVRSIKVYNDSSTLDEDTPSMPSNV